MLTIESIPDNLINQTGEDCFFGCLGLAMLALEDPTNWTITTIKRQLERPDEDYTPMSRVIAWLRDRGYDTKCIEKQQEGPDQVRYWDGIRQAGAEVQDREPTEEDVFLTCSLGGVAILQVCGSVNSIEPDHAVVIQNYGDTREDGVMVIDPDGCVYGMPGAKSVWGNFPNLMSISRAHSV